MVGTNRNQYIYKLNRERWGTANRDWRSDGCRFLSKLSLLSFPFMSVIWLFICVSARINLAKVGRGGGEGD